MAIGIQYDHQPIGPCINREYQDMGPTPRNLGFKAIDASNWLESDGLWLRVFRRSSQSWLEENLKPQLREEVPIEVRKLFEVARAALIYGYLFYPLCSLGQEQLYRILETSLTYKCNSMGAPKSLEKFQMKVRWLINSGVIAKNEEPWWDAVRDLRNMTSHPERPMITPPAGELRIVGEKLNVLFANIKP